VAANKKALSRPQGLVKIKESWMKTLPQTDHDLGICKEDCIGDSMSTL
jgi:hypothetical protein